MNAERLYADVRMLGRVELGPMLDSERGLVYDGFIRGWTDAQGHGKGTRHHAAYAASAANHIEALLQRASVLVARDAECQALAYGWCMYDGNIDAVHWTSVKQAFRRQGIARLMLRAVEPSAYTHRSRFDALAQRMGLEYRPLSGQRRVG